MVMSEYILALLVGVVLAMAVHLPKKVAKLMVAVEVNRKMLDEMSNRIAIINCKTEKLKQQLDNLLDKKDA